MTRINLFDEARKNASSIECEFVREAAANPALEAAAERLQTKSYISTNRRYDALISFLETNSLPSGYRHVQNLARRHGKTIRGPEDFSDFLRILWGNTTPRFYIRRRVEFLKTFSRGEDHQFGALNAGGPGAAAQNGAYGEYCIVFKREVFDQLDSVAYCKRDTLAEDKYWQCGDNHRTECRGSRTKNCPARRHKNDEQLRSLKCQINFTRLFAAYAPHSHRGRLAAMKYKDRIGKPGWDDENILEARTGETEEYIEVCFVLEATIDHVEEVRLHPELICSIFDEICVDENDLGKTASILEFHRKVWDLLEQKGIACNFPWKDQ